MKLSYSQTQTNTRGEDESMLTVFANYDEETREVTFDCIQAFDYKSLQTTDLTRIYVEQLPATVETMMEEIDWNQVYLDQKPSSSLFEQVTRIAYSGYMSQDSLNKMIGGTRA